MSKDPSYKTSDSISEQLSDINDFNMPNIEQILHSLEKIVDENESFVCFEDLNRQKHFY